MFILFFPQVIPYRTKFTAVKIFALTDPVCGMLFIKFEQFTFQKAPFYETKIEYQIIGMHGVKNIKFLSK